MASFWSKGLHICWNSQTSLLSKLQILAKRAAIVDGEQGDIQIDLDIFQPEQSHAQLSGIFLSLKIVKSWSLTSHMHSFVVEWTVHRLSVLFIVLLKFVNASLFGIFV
jgi:hypothetical protein